MQLKESMERSILARRLQSLAVCCGTPAPRTQQDAQHMAEELGESHNFVDLLYVMELLQVFCGLERQRLAALHDLLSRLTLQDRDCDWRCDTTCDDIGCLTGSGESTTPKKMAVSTIREEDAGGPDAEKRTPRDRNGCKVRNLQLASMRLAGQCQKRPAS